MHGHVFVMNHTSMVQVEYSPNGITNYTKKSKTFENDKHFQRLSTKHGCVQNHDTSMTPNILAIFDVFVIFCNTERNVQCGRIFVGIDRAAFCLK